MFFMFTGQIFSDVAQDRHEGRCGGPMCTAQRLLHFFFFNENIKEGLNVPWDRIEARYTQPLEYL